MPITRKGLTVSTPPRKKIANEDKHAGRSIPGPQPTRSPMTRENDITNSKGAEAGIIPRMLSSSTMVAGSTDEPSRRSGRQRMVSKRLQDMELNYGTRKQQGKRQPEGESSEGLPKKKARSSLKSAGEIVWQVKGSTQMKVTDRPKTFPVIELRIELPEETPLPTEPLNTSQSSGKSSLLENQPLEKTPAQLVKSQHQELSTYQPLETFQPVKSDVQELVFEDTAITNVVMSHSEQTISIASNVLTEQSHNQYIIINDHICSNVSPVSLVQQAELPECDAESFVENIAEAKDGQEMESTAKELRNTEETSMKESTMVVDCMEVSNENSLSEPVSINQAESGKEVQEEKLEDVEEVDADVEHPKDIPQENDAASDLKCTSIMICAEEPEELASADQLQVEPATEGTAEVLMSASSQQSVGVVQKEVRDEEKLEKASPDTTAHVAQFVVLDDGRQLLLSNADALETGADAVASLSQSMKDVTFVINQDGMEITSVGSCNPAVVEMPEGETVTSLRELVSVTKGNPKIKFVTVNTDTATNTTDGKVDKAMSYTPQPCNIDMMVNANGQLSAGPATILSADGFYRCSMCAYKTDKKANWYKHRYTHMSHRRYLCDKCDHKATTSSNLKRHMLIHSETKIFKCGQCESEFRQKIHLIRHVNYRHIKKMIKCKHCDYVCSNVKPDLEIHMKRRHPSLDEFQFRCDKCGFNAASFRDLKQHQKFHRRGPELKLYCEQCSFVTDCESRLRRHLLVHNKLRPYWCSLCSYKASQKEHVLRHLRTKHKMVAGSPLMETVEERNGEVVTLMNMVGADMGHGEVGVVGEHELSMVTGQTWMVLEAKDGVQQVVCVSDGDGSGAVEQQIEPSITDTTTGTDQVAGIAQGVEEHIQEEEEGEQEVQQTQVLLEQTEVEENTMVEGKADSAKLHPEPQIIIDTNTVIPPPSALEEAAGDTDSDKQWQMNTVLQQQKQSHLVVDKDDTHQSSRIRILSRRVIEASDISQVDVNHQKKVRRKKYEPADFSTREKVFSCIHCTMKFAKLINLYKHLAVQHKDVHATKADGLHTCVWCEYQTNKWKNLLVHMRKHNFREEYGMVSTRYACVVCTYSSQHRKALYAHMMKKHKIQIYVKPDGSASCIIDDTIPGTMSATDGSVVVLQRPRTKSVLGSKSPPPGISPTAQPQHVVMTTTTVKQPTASNSQLVSVMQEQAATGTQMVMVELEPGMPATAVEIMTPAHDHRSVEDVVDHEAADAIEGLQALAEQVMAAEQEEEVQACVEAGGQIGGAVDVNCVAGLGGNEQYEGQRGEVDDDAQTHIHIQDCAGQVMEDSSFHLTPDQLMQLTSGDFIEINGEMYKVEVAEETATS